MRDHERFLIRSCLRHLACLEEEVEQMDCEILQRMQEPPFQGAFQRLKTIPASASWQQQAFWQRQVWI